MLVATSRAQPGGHAIAGMSLAILSSARIGWMFGHLAFMAGQCLWLPALPAVCH
ncbi:MAG: hypothetical protein U1F83_12735 [Verrucomicrobiota bacterium]